MSEFWRVAMRVLLFYVTLLTLAVPSKASETITYSYDELGRLVVIATTGSPNDGQSVSTSFDPVGNRTNYAITGVQTSTPTLTIVNTTNGSEPGTNGVLTVTQSVASASNTTVSLSYSGTASNGVDYTAPTSVTIPAGSTSATVTLTVVDDATLEGSETATVTLASVTAGSASIGTPSAATNTIADNESATLTIANTTNGSEPGTNGVLTVTQSVASASNTTVSLSYSGTASNGVDYTAPASVTIPAGSTSATVTLTVVDDVAIEGTESATVTLASVSAGLATIGTPSASTNFIADNDVQAADISIGNAIATEGSSLTFTVTRSGNTATAVSVTYTPVSGTAVAGSDFAAATGSVTFGSGQVTALITVNTIDDTLVEGTEFMSVTLSAPSSGAAIVNGTGNGTINDNDPMNQPPVANPDSTSMFSCQIISINALQNDTDPENNLPLTLVSVTGATNGFADIVNNMVQYSASSGGYAENLTYIVADSLGAQSNGTINIGVFARTCQ